MVADFSDIRRTVTNCPHCIGATDGRHDVVLRAPLDRDCSDCFDHETTSSIVLFASVAADYRLFFSYADVGSCQDRTSDGGVFEMSTALFRRRRPENGSLNLPDLRPSGGRRKPMTCVFVADDAFCSVKRRFDRRLFRVRQTVENVFGTTSAAFRVPRRPLNLLPDTAQSVAPVCVNVHDYLRQSSNSRRSYTPVESGEYDIFRTFRQISMIV